MALFSQGFRFWKRLSHQSNYKHVSIREPEHLQFWQENGYLYLPGFFSEDIIEDVNRVVSEVWRQCPPFVVVDDLVTGRRKWMSDLYSEEKLHHYKVNDLYLNYKEILHLALHETLV
ncbi:MAG TPA: hypothetical protein V6D48_01455, partial [Oculatellaceae cyanobacterium]